MDATEWDNVRALIAYTMPTICTKVSKTTNGQSDSSVHPFQGLTSRDVKGGRMGYGQYFTASLFFEPPTLSQLGLLQCYMQLDWYFELMRRP